MIIRGAVAALALVAPHPSFGGHSLATMGASRGTTSRAADTCRIAPRGLERRGAPTTPPAVG
jgi:hypothetical protein